MDHVNTSNYRFDFHIEQSQTSLVPELLTDYRQNFQRMLNVLPLFLLNALLFFDLNMFSV